MSWRDDACDEEQAGGIVSIDNHSFEFVLELLLVLLFIPEEFELLFIEVVSFITVFILISSFILI
jgi:hypothetical protein